MRAFLAWRGRADQAGAGRADGPLAPDSRFALLAALSVGGLGGAPGRARAGVQPSARAGAGSSPVCCDRVTERRHHAVSRRPPRRGPSGGLPRAVFSVLRAAAQPSLFTCRERPRASAPGGTSSVSVAPAP